MENYYIYAYLDPKDDTVRYIGKGKNDRLNTHWKRREFHWNDLFKEFLYSIDSPKIVKLIENLSNSQSYIEEYNLIKKYGRIGFDKNGTLFNRSAGFENINIPDGISLEDYLDNRPHFNFKHVDEEIKQEIILLYNGGLGLVSISKSINMGPEKIKQILLENNIELRKRGGQLGSNNGMYGVKRENNAHFTGKKHKENSREKISNTLKLLDRGKHIKINNIEYVSIREATKYTNIPASTISRNIGKTIIRNNISYKIEINDDIK